MSTVEKTVDVHVPVPVAYDQWTQFEEFPQFMEGVEEVEQLNDTTLRWRVNIAGADRTFDTMIEHQEPDRRISWKTMEGEDQAGEVTFEPLGDDQTRVHLQMRYEPERWTEKVADFLNVIDQRVEGDLERFKSFIEERGRETGAWRGRIESGTVQEGDRVPGQPPPATQGPGTPPATGAGRGDVPTQGAVGDATPGGEPHERE
jgi:uncharacterized membrane protein